jgi:hypothetical protein
MKAGTYYAIAAVLVLATLPMYRYIFARAREVDQSRVQLVEQASVRYVLREAQPGASYPSRVALLPGELCEAGVVVLASGNSYTQAVDSSGHAVRCEQGFALR